MQINAKKSLGQHFLFDQNICSAIVSSSFDIRGQVVLEVGPGHGSLTRAILEKEPKHLFLIEKDFLLAAKLKDSYASREDVTIIEGDALKVNIRSLTHEKIVIIANLPYNVGTQLLCDWLVYSSDIISHMTLMLQKEVVERVCAQPKTKNYGRLSILCQLLGVCSKSFDVDAKAFTPPPKVTSSILQVAPIPSKLGKDELKTFQNVLRACFSSRRKMLKSALKAFLSQQDFSQLAIEPTKRAEELCVDDFVRIAKFCNKSHF